MKIHVVALGLLMVGSNITAAYADDSSNPDQVYQTFLDGASQQAQTDYSTLYSRYSPATPTSPATDTSTNTTTTATTTDSSTTTPTTTPSYQ